MPIFYRHMQRRSRGDGALSLSATPQSSLDIKRNEIIKSLTNTHTHTHPHIPSQPAQLQQCDKIEATARALKIKLFMVCWQLTRRRHKNLTHASTNWPSLCCGQIASRSETAREKREETEREAQRKSGVKKSRARQSQLVVPCRPSSKWKSGIITKWPGEYGRHLFYAPRLLKLPSVT